MGAPARWAEARLCLALMLTALSCARPDGETVRAPYVPTPHDVVRGMLKLAKVQKGDLVYDLGCGDRRIAIAAARDFGAHAVGFEIDSKLVEQARTNVREAGVADLAQIVQADIFDLDLRPASVVSLYLLQIVNDRLVPQLAELAPGSRIVSHQYRLRGLRPRKELRVVSHEDRRNHTIFLWILPFRGEPRRSTLGHRKLGLVTSATLDHSALRALLR